jgi:hypothetical protein
MAAVGHQAVGAPLVQRIELNMVTGGLDDLASADVESGVVDGGPVGRIRPPEHKVAGLEISHRHRHAGGVVLIIGDAGESDAGGLPGGQRQARAVEADRAVSAPDLGLTELGEGEENGLIAWRHRLEHQADGGWDGAGIAERP